MPADTAAVASSEVSGTRPSERRVLVVDDNIDSAEMLVELLAMWGHTTVHAPDGPRALAIAPEFAPDVVLLDIGLPRLDGYEVARLMRQDRNLDGARIIAMTGAVKKFQAGILPAGRVPERRWSTRAVW